MSKKKNNIYKEFLNPQSEFSHHCSCWARNHMGWAKMKRANKKIAKRRMKQKLNKELKEGLKNE